MNDQRYQEFSTALREIQHTAAGMDGSLWDGESRAAETERRSTHSASLELSNRRFGRINLRLVIG